MKRLLTFIYGLLILLTAIACYHKFTTTEQWYCWLFFILFVVLAHNGVEKLDKSTED